MPTTWFRKSRTLNRVVHSTATPRIIVCLCSWLAMSIASFASSNPAKATLHISVNVVAEVQSEQMAASQAFIPQHQDIIYDFRPDVQAKATAAVQEYSAAEEQRKLLKNSNREQEAIPALLEQFTFVSK